MKKVFLFILATNLLFFCAGCSNQSENVPAKPTEEKNSKEMILAEEYLKKTFGDVNVTELTFVESYPLYEASVDAYSIKLEPLEEAQKGMDIFADGKYFFFKVGSDGVIQEALGMRELQGKPLEEIALAMGWNVQDIDYSIRIDGFPGYFGPGSQNLAVAENNLGSTTDEKLADWDVYNAGDYWGKVSMDGLSYIYYFRGPDSRGEEDDERIINSIVTTREDISTYRGGRIGMTKEEIHSLYPEANADEDIAFEGDYLKLCASEVGLGNNLVFYFAGDIVTEIQIVDMLD